MEIKASFAPVAITAPADSPWRLSCESFEIEPGLDEIRLQLEADQPLPPPAITLTWGVPMLDMGLRWTPLSGPDRHIPPDWASAVTSNLASSIPVMAFMSLNGENRMTFAVSEALRNVVLNGGVCEENNRIHCKISLFTVPEAPLRHYSTTVRVDCRSVFYADAIRAVSDWHAAFSAYTPAIAPQAAFEPIYSTWYSYHQALFAGELEAECALAAQYGMKGVIVDDGWQTDDNNRGYAFCGDWEVSKNRFPDMRAHVQNIHALGMKYVVWFSVPFAGDKSEVIKTFAGKSLFHIDGLSTAVLDPRFPEVREYLIGTYERAVRDWDIDGLKLDFIDCFRLEGEDPALKDDYAGRDIRSVPEAVDCLLSEAMARLRRLKDDILIEFRQSYIGPAIRKYGNMFRAADCPADAYSNRIRTIDLRLTSGTTAVHSDMLEWHAVDSVESAALQVLAILFSVPQISVKLADVPEAHRIMLKFWMDFCISRQKVLLKGTLKPFHPELNYPLVVAEDGDDIVVAVYDPGRCVRLPYDTGSRIDVVNATRDAGVVVELSHAASAEILNTMGGVVATHQLDAGLQRVDVPPAGLLRLAVR